MSFFDIFASQHDKQIQSLVSRVGTLEIELGTLRTLVKNLDFDLQQAKLKKRIQRTEEENVEKYQGQFPPEK